MHMHSLGGMAAMSLHLVQWQLSMELMRTVCFRFNCSCWANGDIGLKTFASMSFKEPKKSSAGYNLTNLIYWIPESITLGTFHGYMKFN